MAAPVTRSEFKEYCLRRLGKPVITIDVDDTQVEDRIDDALAYYQDYHFDGTTLEYFVHQVTASDISNEFITVPDTIVGVVESLDFKGLFSGTGILSNRQLFIEQLLGPGLGGTQRLSPVDGYMLMERVAAIDEIFSGKVPIRYNRTVNKLFLDTDWVSNIRLDMFLVFKAYQIVDPDTFPDVWKDLWLQKYATALIKQQWGSNLTKFEGMQMPGGITFSGQKIYDDATEEIRKMEEDMITGFSLPVHDMVG